MHIIIFFLFLMLFCSAERAAAEDKIVTFYKGLEPLAVELWKRTQEQLANEDNKKISQETREIAEQGFRLAIYNRVYHIAKCVELKMPFATTTEYNAALIECEKESIEQFSIMLKVSEYTDLIPIEQRIKCEMLSRLFKDEVRFPPYEMLKKPGRKLMLLDFERLAACTTEVKD